MVETALLDGRLSLSSNNIFLKDLTHPSLSGREHQTHNLAMKIHHWFKSNRMQIKIKQKENTMDTIFIEAFDKRIDAWHNFSDYPLKGELLEEQIHKALLECGYNSEWDAGSHKKGVDIEGDYRFSIKSATISKGGKLKFSSYRTTSHKTIEEKVLFFEEVEKSFDSYFLLARTNTTYYAIVLDTSYLNFSDGVWEVTKSGWKYKNDFFKATITKSMSHQLWNEIEFNKIKDKVILEKQYG